ncbi:unnamed protein product, partial [Durusdinium trenchii]
MWLHGGLGSDLQDDLWKFSFRSSSSSWAQIQPIENRPSARAHHAAAWDETNSAIWVHGGYDSHGLSNELWAFDSQTSNWSLVSQAGPGLRAYHVAAWDSSNQAIWLHGGLGGSTGVAQRELWRFNILSHSWDLIANQVQDGPVARYYHAAAWDVTSASLWIHGGFSGYSAGNCLHDTWRFLVTTTSTTRTASTSSTSSATTLTTSSSSATTTSITSTRSTSSSITYSTTTATTTSSTLTSSISSSTTLSTTTTSSISTSSSTASTTSSTLTSSTSSSTTLSATTTSSSSTSSSTASTTSSTSTSSISTSSSTTLSTTTTSSSGTSSNTATSSGTASTSSTTSSTSFSTTTTFSSTSSSVTRSASTSSSSTRTRTTSMSSTQTFTTSTSSTATTTTTCMVQNLSGIICILVGVAIVAFAALVLACWMRRRRRKVVACPAINTEPLVPAPFPSDPCVPHPSNAHPELSSTPDLYPQDLEVLQDEHDEPALTLQFDPFQPECLDFPHVQPMQMPLPAHDSVRFPYVPS